MSENTESQNDNGVRHPADTHRTQEPFTMSETNQETPHLPADQVLEMPATEISSSPSAHSEQATPREDPSRTPRLVDPGYRRMISPQQVEDYFGPRSIPTERTAPDPPASLPSSVTPSPLVSTSTSSTSLPGSQASAIEQEEYRIARTTEAFNDEAPKQNGFSIASSHPATHSTPSTIRGNDGVSRYPNQSLAALHTQSHTLPYNYMKSRGSDYGPTYHPSVSPSPSTERTRAISISRSADQTPLGSPGLFQAHKRTGGSDSTMASTSASLLHPIHQAPKETYKLIKDFDSTTGNKIMNNYEVLEKLGVGSQGAVKRARNLVTEEEVAIKIVRRYGKKGRLGKQETPEDKVRKEVAVLKKVRHPHVVSLLEVIDDPEYGKVYLVLEYVKKGEIIWRTETTKEIADYEMNRINREIKGEVDGELETEQLDKLNAVLAARHRVQLDAEGLTVAGTTASDTTLEDVKEKGLDLRRVVTTDHPDRDDILDARSTSLDEGDWSMESGGYEEYGDEQGNRSRQLRRQASTRLTVDFNGESSTPRAVQSGHDHRIDPYAVPAIPVNLAGSQYGPYVCDDFAQQSSVVDFGDLLKYASENHERWTSEEDAFRYVPCLTMSQARHTFRDTVLGLEYLHFHGIIHRDIKPANLLWTSDYRVKISDFGVSYVGRPIREKEDDDQDGVAEGSLDEEFELAKTVGTPAFYAPELCDPDLFDTEKTPVRPQITGQIDVWALGVTLYCMIFGRLPFWGENQFEMFESIAWHDVFVSQRRLRGVDEDGRVSMNSNKRLPHSIEYEEVSDTLKDLLRRLLEKRPEKRITLKEVKHHPWVVEDIQDRTEWLDATDPSLQSSGKQIEVSPNEVQNAVASLNLVDRIRHGIRRLGSVVRGRDSRRRAESNAKDPNGSVGSTSSRASTIDRDGRRPSLRGDEQIYSALKASRETSDHPLAQSVVASPVAERDEDFFVHPISHLEFPTVSTLASPLSMAHRPLNVERNVSTTDSIRTIRPAAATSAMKSGTPPTISEDHATTDSAASSSTGLSSILGLATRRFHKPFRSRDRGLGSRDNSTASSRTSSYEHMASSFEEAHAYPSVALSPAVAAGTVDHSILATKEEHDAQAFLPASDFRRESSPKAFELAEEQNLRRTINEQRQAAAESRSQSRTLADSHCPPSPDDMIPMARRGSQDQREGLLPVSSSDDQFALSESFSIPSIPSTSTSTSQPENMSSMLATGETLTEKVYIEGRRPKGSGARPTTFDEDEAGYNGDGDGDDSEDDGLVMGGRH